MVENFKDEPRRTGKPRVIECRHRIEDEKGHAEDREPDNARGGCLCGGVRRRPHDEQDQRGNRKERADPVRDGVDQLFGEGVFVGLFGGGHVFNNPEYVKIN